MSSTFTGNGHSRTGDYTNDGLKFCTFCNSMTSTLCKDGACTRCHGMNLCHGGNLS